MRQTRPVAKKATRRSLDDEIAICAISISMACGRAGRACSANSRRSICPGAPIPHIPPARDRTAKNMRRIDRANAGFSRKVSGIRDWANCVVVDAVDLEPLQHPNSLLTGKRTGNFIESACRVRFLCTYSEQIQRL